MSFPFPGICVLLMLVYYAAIITDGTFQIWAPVQFGRVFNSMLDHLLHGRFDVDADSIGLEGFTHDGRTYAYFGIVLALIRLPLVATRHFLTTDATIVSCVVASAVAGFFKLRIALTVRANAAPGPLREPVFWALAASIVFGGPQVQLLRASIYQEAVDWAGAMAAVFVYHAVLGLIVECRFSGRRLSWMAVAAGLALSTRVSIGLGLYAALGLLMIRIVWSDRERCGGVERAAFRGEILAPAGLLLLFAALCGAVNYARWGNPLTFMDLHLYLMEHTMFPDRLARLDRTGALNLSRAWFGLLYFILPIWAIVRPDGQLLFAEYQSRMFDSVEMPPSSFLITDPVLLILAGIAIVHLLGRNDGRIANRAHVAALLAGLAVPIFFISMMLTLALRYKIEFYPALELAAFLGYRALCLNPLGPRRRTGLNCGIWVACLVGVTFSTGLVFLYQFTPFGPVEATFHGGWIEFYRHQRLQSLLP